MMLLFALSRFFTGQLKKMTDSLSGMISLGPERSAVPVYIKEK